MLSKCSDGVRNRIVGHQKYCHHGDAEQQRILQASTAEFFGKLVLKKKEKTANLQPSPSPTADAGESGKVYHDENKTVSRLRKIQKSKESDGHYPQSWLIAYFALNALRACGGGADANPSNKHDNEKEKEDRQRIEEKEDNDNVIPEKTSNHTQQELVCDSKKWLVLDDASADALVNALISCCTSIDDDDDEKERLSFSCGGEEAGLTTAPPLLPSSPSPSPPLWLQKGLGGSDLSSYDYRLSSAIGVSPDGSSACPSPLVPTVTLTFCALQTLMNVTRRKREDQEQKREQDEENQTKSRDGMSTMPIVSLLEEASMRVHVVREEEEKGECDAGFNMTLLGDVTVTMGTCTSATNVNASVDGESKISRSRCETKGQRRRRTQRKGLLAHQMALFAWRRLREFARGLLRSSGASGSEGRSSVSNGISDPRDLYSALMTLWLVYREYAKVEDENEEKHGAPTTEKGEEEDEEELTAACPFNSAADGIASVLEGFVRETWRDRDDGRLDGDGEGCVCAMKAAITEWLIERCYVPHEGAFGSPIPPRPVGVAAVPAVAVSESFEDGSHPFSSLPPLECRKHQPAVEAHTGMTYCCVVSLVLLGYFCSGKNDLERETCGGGKDRPAGARESKKDNVKLHVIVNGLKRYLYARQAHFGLSVSEYDDYEDTASSEKSTAEKSDGEADSTDDVQSVDTGRTQQQTSVQDQKGEVVEVDDHVTSFIAQEQRRLLVASSLLAFRGGGSARRHQCPQEQTFRTCGFQGRPNKDSDTCYSFWALGSLRALAVAESREEAEQRRREDVVDRFLADSPLSDSQRLSCPSLRIRRGSQGFPSMDLLHDEHSLHAFTLLTAGYDVPACSGCGCSGIDAIRSTLGPSEEDAKTKSTTCTSTKHTGSVAHRPYLLAKDADAETTPDPLHSFLGLAGLSPAFPYEGPFGSSAVFPFA